jgi:hypothetical protein
MTIIRIRKGYFAHAALLGAALSVVGCAGDLPAGWDGGGSSGNNASGSGSGGSGSSSGPATVMCPDVPTLLASECTASGCHGKVGPQYGLDMQSPGLAARVVGKMSQEMPGTLLVDPMTPANSDIYAKLTMNAPYGLRMPNNTMAGDPQRQADGTFLTSANQMCVLQWVTMIGSMGGGGSSSSGGGSSSDAGTTPVTDGGGGGSTNGG